jgi:transcriptional regulator with XRE-family HTH domain
MFQAWEEGHISPSLPELEVLSYSLSFPLRHFWSKSTISDDTSLNKTLDLPGFVGIRQRLLGALLRQMREKANVSPRALSRLSGVSTERIKAYELGERPIPLPELEGLTDLLGGKIEMFFDQTSRVGIWMIQQETIRDFLQLPPELQEFFCKPVNRPYLELAMKLSGMSIDKLHSLSENFPDIKF